MNDPTSQYIYRPQEAGATAENAPIRAFYGYEDSNYVISDTDDPE